MRGVRLEVCSPFPQSQLGTGSWPHCPTVRRQRCEGWLHSSPGSLSPVEEKQGRDEKDRKGHTESIERMFCVLNQNFTNISSVKRVLTGSI